MVRSMPSVRMLAPSKIASPDVFASEPEQAKKSNGVLPDSEAKKEKPAMAGVASTSRTGSVDSNHVVGAAGANPWKSTVSMPIRDPKSRARSRDYLKQYVEISSRLG